MTNFVFISPEFPKTYFNFCDRLKKNGITVLGISSTPYDELKPELKAVNDADVLTILKIWFYKKSV